MSSPSLCANAWAFIGGLTKKPEYNGKKVQLISKEPGWWVCRADNGTTLRVKEIHLVPRETPREEGDQEETHIHEKEMPRQPKIPELGPNLKTFVINLKRRPDRRQSIEALCKELKLNYEIVEACDGRALSGQPNARFEIVRTARSSRSSSASPSSSASRPQQTPEVVSSSSKRKVDKVKKVSERIVRKVRGLESTCRKVKPKRVAASKMTRTQRAQVAAHLAKNPKAESLGKPKPAESSKGKPVGFSNLTLRRFRAHFQWNGRSSQLIRMAMHRVQSSDKTQKGHELWGAIGCNISHQIVLQQILDDPKLEYALILEDDCIKGKDPEDIRRIFNSNIRMIDEYDWQLIYLGGSICTKYRKKEQQAWRINDHVMRAQGVYLTHAYVIKREIIPEIMKNLEEGFAADAAFVRWLRKEWGSGNTNCCFFFEPQLLTQPGNDTRWKDSDIFAEGAYFREAFEEKGEEYSFSRACDLRKKIKKQTIDRKEDVNDEQRVYHMDEEGKFKADIKKVKELEDKKKKTKKQDEEEKTKKEAIKNEPEERKKKESVKMKVDKEEEEPLKERNEKTEKNEKKEIRKKTEKKTEKLQEQQDATDKTTQASKVRRSRKAKESTVEEAEPARPRKRAKKAKLPLEDEIDEPLSILKSSSARDPSGGELEQSLEDWDSEDPWQEECEGQEHQGQEEYEEQSPALDEEIELGQTSKEDDLESQVLALLKRHQEAPAFLKAMQNAGQQKMEMQKLFTKKNSKKGPIEELKEQIIWILNGARLNLGMAQDALTAAVFAAVKNGMIGRLRSTVEKLHKKGFSESYRNKMIDCFMCALEFHFHVSTEDLQRLEASMRGDFSTECAKELEAYLGKGPLAPFGIVVEASAGLLSTLFEKVKAARTQLKAAELCQNDLLELTEGHKKRTNAESAPPLPPSMPSMDRPGAKVKEPTQRSSEGSRKRLRPCPSEPQDQVPSPPTTDTEGDTSLDPMRRKDLQSMSVKELRKKVAELNIPHDVAKNFLDKDEIVEAILKSQK